MVDPLARPLAALSAALLPLAALAQEAGGNADPAQRTGAGFTWLWVIAVAAIVVVLFRNFFSGRRHRGRPAPPARTP